jgi:hypothetical protein
VQFVRHFVGTPVERSRGGPVEQSVGDARPATVARVTYESIRARRRRRAQSVLIRRRRGPFTDARLL